MHHGVLTRNGEFAFLDRRFFDDLPTESFCRLTDRDVGAMIVNQEPALARLEELGALSQWFLQRLNKLSGGHLMLHLEEDLAGWFTLEVLAVRDEEVIALLEFDGSDLHIDCTLHGEDQRLCVEALQKLVRVCVRDFHDVQELPEETVLVKSDWR